MRKYFLVIFIAFSFGKSVSEEKLEPDQESTNLNSSQKPVKEDSIKESSKDSRFSSQIKGFFQTDKAQEEGQVEGDYVDSGEVDISEEPEESPRDNFSEREQSVEEFKVTGSRIRRIEFEGPSPVTIWTKEDLENSGYTTLSEFFTNTSLSNFGGTLLRNRSTLTLVNGARMVYDAGMNFIPTTAIERVEVLKDGASALYGSDVVGGVVNIITKKDFVSPEVSLKLMPSLYPFYKGGSSAEASAVFGKAFSKGHFLSTLQFQYFDSLKVSDRKQWYNDYFLPYSPYPSFHVEGGGGIIVDPKCPPNLQLKQGANILGCNHNFVPYAYIAPRVYYFSSYNYGEYKLKGVNFYTQLFGFFQNSKEPDQAILSKLSLPSGHKMSAGNGSAGSLRYLFKDFYREESISSAFLDTLVGARGYISKTWDFDLSLKWSNIWEHKTYENHPYLQSLTEALVSGAYDPFNPKVRDLSKVKFHDSLYKDNDTRLFTSLDFSGESGFWDIDLAVGFQAYYNKYRNKADPKVKKGEIFALAPAENKDLPGRTLVATYAEAVKNFSNVLEVQVAGRIDHYSDFGWTANPKLALYYKPVSNFLVRSSVGTSFEAPDLDDLYTPKTTGYISIYDTVACYNELKGNKHFDPIYQILKGDKFKSQSAKDKLIKQFLVEQSDIIENKDLSAEVKKAFKNLTGKIGDQDYCRTKSVFGTGKGNRNLKETKALTASLGFHWDLNENHSLKGDYWFNALSGTPIASLHENKKTIDAELLHGKAYVEKEGIVYERDGSHPLNPVKEETPVSSLINVGKKKLSGFDLTWESDFPHWTFGKGYFYFKDDFSYVLTSGVENFPGMYAKNLGKFGLPKWRNFTTLGWKSPRHNLSLLVKTVAGTKKYNNEFERLKLGYLLDLFYQYRMSAKTSFKLGWYNLLFSDPVLDNSIKQGKKFDSKFFDRKGPHFFVEVRRIL